MKFNPENKDTLNYGECLDPAMAIKDINIAAQYLNDYALWILKKGSAENIEKAIQIAKSNIGYYAGYFDDEIRKQVETIFDCSHPIFGRAINGTPTPEEAFELGKN